MQGACRLRTSALLEQLSFWGYLPCLAPRSDLICLSCRCGFYVKILSNTNIKPKPYQVKKSHWLQGEKYGVSRNRGQINTWNGQVLKVLLDAWVGYRGRCRRLPWAALVVEEQGWHKHHFWKRGFPAWLHAPSPSAPETLFWASWQEASKWKGRTKKCIFYHLQIPTAQGYEWKTLILWPFGPHYRRRTGKKPKPNY